MSQITAAQQQHLQATAERAMAKLTACFNDLPDDERAVLAAVLQQEESSASADDTAGFWFPSLSHGVTGAGRGSSGGLDAVNSVDWQKVYDALSVKW